MLVSCRARSPDGEVGPLRALCPVRGRGSGSERALGAGANRSQTRPLSTCDNGTLVNGHRVPFCCFIVMKKLSLRDFVNITIYLFIVIGITKIDRIDASELQLVYCNVIKTNHTFTRTTGNVFKDIVFIFTIRVPYN